jgi:WD40 repeat protein
MGQSSPAKGESNAKLISKTVDITMEGNIPQIVSEETKMNDIDESLAVSRPPDEDKEITKGSSTGVEISDYEKRRAANIARNQAFLKSLGLIKTRDKLRGSIEGNSTAKRQKRGRSKPRVKRSTPVLPTRRSRRAAGLAAKRAMSAIAAGESTEFKEAEQEVESDDDDYEDSSVLKYCANSMSPKDATHSAKHEGTVARSESGTTEVKPDDGSSWRLRSSGAASFRDDSCKRIYGLSILDLGGGQGNVLLASGGHGGRVAVFGAGSEFRKRQSGADDEEDQDGASPLLSFKGHSGWVCGVHFLCDTTPGSASGWSGGLLTAANDGAVSLWNVQRARCANSRGNSMKPKRVTTEKVHNGSGIFSLHARKRIIVTASKDSTVGYSKLRSDKIELTASFDYHGSVVKCARIQPGVGCHNVVASVGNDSSLCIWDVRLSEKHGAKDARHLAQCVNDASSLALNSVRWHPTDSNLVMTAGFEPVIKIFDRRQLGSALVTLNGHHRCNGGRAKSIHHPLWPQAAKGKIVLSGGSNSLDLSIFSSTTGKMLSRGQVGFEPTAMCEQGNIVAAAHGKDISFFDLHRSR